MATSITTTDVLAAHDQNKNAANAQTTQEGDVSDQNKNVPANYRHIAAVHSRLRTSCLSHDVQESPSFLGFRNLMIIVLSEWLLLVYQAA